MTSNEYREMGYMFLHTTGDPLPDEEPEHQLEFDFEDTDEEDASSL